MAKYFLTKKAVEDLSKTWDYTYQAWLEKQAGSYYELLIKTCQAISKKPGVGKNYDEIAKDILGFRVAKHIIFYRVTKPNEIAVVRILHERMDLRNRLAE